MFTMILELIAQQLVHTQKHGFNSTFNIWQTTIPHNEASSTKYKSITLVDDQPSSNASR
uniref:Uncharacterized protein n=1 Tax=Arundo donax TaxID=35708 RepID=A0A0A9PD52_ARUDO